MPLEDLLGKDAKPPGPGHELVVALRRGHTPGSSLSDVAGRYSCGDGFVSQSLEVDPAGRYDFEWHDDTGSNEPHGEDRTESRGRCSMVDGTLRLAPEGPFSSDLRALIGNDFVPIIWDSYRYLIPRKDIVGFCSSVNRGDSPRLASCGDT